MPIHIHCDTCQKQYRLKDQSAGKRFKCRACGQRIAIPPMGSLALPEQPKPRSSSPQIEANPLDFHDNGSPMVELEGEWSKGRVRHKVLHQRHVVKMLGGLALWLVGFVITVLTYDVAASGNVGGYFLFAWGPMLSGPPLFFAGLIGVVKAKWFLAGRDFGAISSQEFHDILEKGGSTRPSLVGSVLAEVIGWTLGMALTFGLLGALTCFANEKSTRVMTRDAAAAFGLILGAFLGLIVGVIQGVRAYRSATS